MQDKSEKEDQDEYFKRITAAYEVLSNQAQKAKYDADMVANDPRSPQPSPERS